jgi:tRNA-specific 2-thiouridylase
MRHGEKSAVAACAAPAAESLLPLLSPRLDHKQGCCSASDAEDARRVADRLDIPFYALNFEEEFARIIDYFVDEYTQARTPNPCVMCNNWLKFGKLFDYADSVNAEFVATGHYARLVAGRMYRGRDADKDQSYVLFGVRPEYLARIMLPVGDFTKPEIRARAGQLGLRVADKKDSQEICFVTSGDHGEFVRQRRGDQDTSGEFVLTDGTVVGRHSGIEQFTIGQRKGLGIAFGEPRYVVRIHAEQRQVVIGTHAELARSELTAGRTNWLAPPPAEPFRGSVQIRYNSPATPAWITPLHGARLRVVFDEPRHGVAPGQAAVCYREDQVLGGGWIE